MEKSYVGMLHEHCPVCLNKDETKSSILLDKRMRNSLEKDNNVIANEPCEKCGNLLKQDMIALVVISNSTSDKRERLDQKDADRTGEIIWLKKHVFREVFNLPGEVVEGHMAFIDVEVRDKLKSMVADSDIENPTLN